MFSVKDLNRLITITSVLEKASKMPKLAMALLPSRASKQLDLIKSEAEELITRANSYCADLANSKLNED